MKIFINENHKLLMKSYLTRVKNFYYQTLTEMKSIQVQVVYENNVIFNADSKLITSNASAKQN